jgi:diacylglycerol O-acyltransferase / wax synthase
MSAPGLPQTNEEAWAIAHGWGTAREMSEFEALMWRVESDPRLRSTMLGVYVLDCEPDWDRLVAAHEWGSRLIPRFRQRVVDPPLHLGMPAWSADPDFDLGYHVRRVRVPDPGSFEQVLELAEQVAMTPFDRARSPWEAVLVDGLEGGRAAYFLKMHHSLTDGQGGVQMLSLLHSRKREPSPDKPMPDPPEPERATPLSVLAEQVSGRARSLPGEAGAAARRVAEVTGGALLRPGAVAGQGLRFGRSLTRVLAPPPAPPSPLLAGRSLSWRFGTLEVGLDELKRAAKAADGSLNDAFIAALLGGFRRYHERQGAELDEMPMAMPISLRKGDHPMGGNRFAGARFAAPAGEPDPAERIHLVHDFVLTARAEPALDALALLAPALNRLPTPLVTRWYRAQTTKLDLQASNVAGIPYTVYMAGAKIERLFPFGPLPGCAVMATLVSHSGTCCIGINCDSAAVADPELFFDCLQEGLDEVLALGAKAERPTTRETATA